MKNESTIYRHEFTHFKHDYKTTKSQRENQHGHKAFLIWFTGLSGSGKSTLANLVEIALHNEGLSTFILDGDNIRQGINKDLSFIPKDRTENIRRIAEISNLMLDAGIITISGICITIHKGQRTGKTDCWIRQFY